MATVVEGEQPQLIDIVQEADGWLKKYLLTYRLPSGEVITYDSVSRKNLEDYRAGLMRPEAVKSRTADAVGIVPCTQDGRLVMLREFRYPLNSWCIAFPAGLVEPGEDPALSITRELAEETGYEALRDDIGAPIVRMMDQAGFSSTGMSDETVHMAYVHVANEPSSQPQFDDKEYIEIFTLPVTEAGRFLATNDTPIGTRAQLILEALSSGPQTFFEL